MERAGAHSWTLASNSSGIETYATFGAGGKEGGKGGGDVTSYVYFNDSRLEGMYQR